MMLPRTKTCPYCHGSGKQSDQCLNCIDCQGTGQRCIICCQAPQDCECPDSHFETDVEKRTGPDLPINPFKRK